MESPYYIEFRDITNVVHFPVALYFLKYLI
eukprot:SAG31_NODE_1716_length_7452_cov_20.182905_1_plen_30_part_00